MTYCRGFFKHTLSTRLGFSHFLSEAKSSASTIGPICAFDTKKYNIVDTLFAVSTSVERDKKIFKISYFCSVLSSLLVENPYQIINSKSQIINTKAFFLVFLPFFFSFFQKNQK